MDPHDPRLYPGTGKTDFLARLKEIESARASEAVAPVDFSGSMPEDLVEQALREVNETDGPSTTVKTIEGPYGPVDLIRLTDAHGWNMHCYRCKRQLDQGALAQDRGDHFYCADCAR